MAFQVVPDVAEFRIVYEWNGGPDEYINTFYVRDTVAPWTGTHLDEVANAIADAWTTMWSPNCVNDAKVDRIDYRDLGDEFGLSGSLAVGYTPSGGVAGQQPVPPASPLLVTLVGDGGSAPRRGHLFLPGAPESVFNPSTMLYDQSIVDSAIAAVEQVRDDVNGLAGAEALVIVSRFEHNPSPPPSSIKRTEAVSNTLSAITGRRLAGSQRDRRPGIGS